MQIDQYWPSLLSVFAASLVAFMSPGPNFVGIVSTTVTSRANGLAVALGCSLGTTFWALMAITGLTTLLALHPTIGSVMQILCGGYLTWLGIKSLRSAMGATLDPKLAGDLVPESKWTSLRRGFLIQVTNPKTALFWLSMVSLVIQPNTPLVVAAILVVGTTLIALVWHSVLAIAFSHAIVIKEYLARRRLISLFFGAIFVVLGGQLVLGAARAVMSGVVS